MKETMSINTVNRNLRRNIALANRIIRQQNEKTQPRKIVIVGPSRCGKTSLVKRFLDNSFTFQYKPTVEDCYNREYRYRGYNLSLDIIDISGSFLSPPIRDAHIKTADVIMLVYEVENLESAKEARSLYKVIRQTREDKMPLVLVGNKTDLKRGSLPPETFQESEEIVDIVNEIQGAKHILTSAKCNMHITDAFEYGLKDVIKRMHTLSMSAQQGKTNEYEADKKWQKEQCCTIL